MSGIGALWLTNTVNDSAWAIKTTLETVILDFTTKDGKKKQLSMHLGLQGNLGKIKGLFSHHMSKYFHTATQCGGGVSCEPSDSDMNRMEFLQISYSFSKHTRH